MILHFLKQLRPLVLVLVVVLPLMLAACGDDDDAGADPVADFYRGKTITIIVGLSPGGGYDFNARTAARYLSEFIPGNPNVIVENMPGAGSMLALIHTYNVAPQDGTVIVSVVNTVFLNQLLGVPEAEFDALQFQSLGGPDQIQYTFFVTPESGIDKIEDLLPSKGGTKSVIVIAIGDGCGEMAHSTTTVPGLIPPTAGPSR